MTECERTAPFDDLGAGRQTYWQFGRLPAPDEADKGHGNPDLPDKVDPTDIIGYEPDYIAAAANYGREIERGVAADVLHSIGYELSDPAKLHLLRARTHLRHADHGRRSQSS